MTPGRWFGTAVLGVAAFVVGLMAYAAIDGVSDAASLGRIISGLLTLGGLAAVLIGLIGAGVALVRGDRRRHG